MLCVHAYVCMCVCLLVYAYGRTGPFTLRLGYRVLYNGTSLLSTTRLGTTVMKMLNLEDNVYTHL